MQEENAGPGGDIRCVQENHTPAHIKEKTNHGYTAVNGQQHIKDTGSER